MAHCDLEIRKQEDDKRQRRFRKGLYVLPSLFTTATIAAGYYAILQTTHGTPHFDNAAKAIGFAVLFDGLDGRIARMTHTCSDFGRELDSLADVITFGVAPAMLAWMWGFRQVSSSMSTGLSGKMIQLGTVATFLFLVAGAGRLARFNITVNPQPSNPGRPGKKYFVGMPIPAGAGVIAAVVHFFDGDPIATLWGRLAWIFVIMLIAYFMVSTWRFYSLKSVNFQLSHSFRLVILFGLVFAGIWFFSRTLLFGLAVVYMASGVFWRLSWLLNRKEAPSPPTYREASQIS